jgi:hypothetical protein
MKPQKLPLSMVFKHHQVSQAWHPLFRQSLQSSRLLIFSSRGRHPPRQCETKAGAGGFILCSPEKQTSVRGLMGSERGYDISSVVGASVPVLREERGNKVSQQSPHLRKSIIVHY